MNKQYFQGKQKIKHLTSFKMQSVQGEKEKLSVSSTFFQNFPLHSPNSSAYFKDM